MARKDRLYRREVSVYLEPWLKQGLVRWAKRENRSLSNLIEDLTKKAYREWAEANNIPIETLDEDEE
ncbi:transcriptional regulator [Leptolyngbya sp. FACHB-261]|uniref:transcriptional regulator n=1 Tax=Leptolyngbya sp. FACHB-261 TaxID=2692806 RepID=UPI001681E56C|nr:transcriptional regulator [Leptolyngbya sp. FACHB-261]MBD2101769.1 transcriptional regulator [Leptolyngbya sp. FACHB-261]